MELSSTQQKALDIFHNEGYVKAWNYWRLMNKNGVIFLGEVPSCEFVDGRTLANLTGLYGIGELCNIDTPWLKFIFNGDLVYVPMKPLMHSVSWQQLYYAGVVYGSGDDGCERIAPFTKQNTTVVIENNTYKVMLISTTDVEMGKKFTFDDDDEWNQLFIPIMKKPGINSEINTYFEYWGQYTEEDLLMDANYGIGSFCWTRNTTKINEYNDRRCVRGGGGVLNQFQFKPSSNYNGRGWRPILRLKS